MSLTTLTSVASEESTFAVTATFTDDAGASVTPNTLAWTLTDDSGNVINSRLSVAVAVPASSVTVVLSGDDLADVASTNRRALAFRGTYDSDLGIDLPMTAECRFTIQRFHAI